MVAEDVKRHDHRRGRDGDHLMGVPFQCDLCHFRNVSGRNPCWNSPVDCNALTGIRQANLDVMWARASSTVATNLSRQRKDYSSAMARYPLRQPLPLLGFEEVEDKVGMTAALITLNASLRQGKYADHLQPDSARKTRSWYNNAHMSGASYLTNTMYAKDEKKLHATSSPTAGEWYVRFTQGMKLRTGQIRKQNEALTTDVILACCEVAEAMWEEEESEAEKEKLEELMCFILLSFGAVLRGEEVPLVSLKGMLDFWEESTSAPIPHIMVALKGRFKGETGHRYHFVPIAVNNQSGVPFKSWTARLMLRRVSLQKRSGGPLFRSSNGRIMRISDLDPRFVELLDKVRAFYPTLIPNKVESSDYSLWRSGRRGATTEAMNLQIDGDTMDLLGRWRKRESARGTEPGLAMRQVYTQVRHALRRMLVFSLAL